jgi:hypothetical protein
MLYDPQRFNLYAYTRNNPLKYVDPKGEAIELSSDPNMRAEQMRALCGGVGEEACRYLYENTERDKKGNLTGRYFLGVLTNGPSGNGADFKDLNPVTAGLAPLIADPQIVHAREVGAFESLPGFLTGGSSLFDLSLQGVTTRPNDPGDIQLWVQNPAIPYGKIKAEWMSDGQPGDNSMGITLFHELGHAGYNMDIRAGRDPQGTTNQRALDLENQVRRNRNPEAATRQVH